MSKKYLTKTNGLLISGLLLWATSLLAYFIDGYNIMVFLYWSVAIVLVGISFLLREKEKIKIIKIFDAQDFLIALILVLIFLPLYLSFLYTIPFQINTDEIAIGSVAKNIISQPIDIFGLSTYWGYPNLIFYLWAWGARLMGGITLLNLRFIHALFGLIIIFLSYLFLRSVSFSKLYAFSGATIIGSQHALLGLSRLGIWNNTLLVIEFAALTILYIGLKHKSLFYTFLGGLVAGFSFYTYFTARIILVIWLFFLIVSCFIIDSQQQKRTTFILALVSIFGFLMVVAPIGLATIKTPSVALSNFWHPFIIFSDGRTLAQDWIAAPTIIEGLKVNFLNGLFMFTGKHHDEGNMYLNYGHGFLDFLSRIFLWLGIIIVIIRLVTKSYPKRKKQDLLALSSFLFLWLFLTLLTTKNPAYLRMFSVLPFVVYLILVAVQETIKLLSKLLREFLNEKKVSLLTSFLLCLVIFSIVFLNLNIYKDYVIAGFKQGNGVGGTGRYIQLRSNITNYTFLLVANDRYPYYDWGDPYSWLGWMKFFSTDDQRVQVVNPQDLFLEDKLTKITMQRPFTLFLNKYLYSQIENNLIVGHRSYQVYNITPDGRLLALEFVQ